MDQPAARGGGAGSLSLAVRRDGIPSLNREVETDDGLRASDLVRVTVDRLPRCTLMAP